MYETTFAQTSRPGRGVIQHFVHLAVAAGLLSMTGIPMVYAADGDPLPEEEVTVTGTRIRQQTGMNTPVPVTTLTTQDLAALNPGASLGDQLDRLPQLFQTESAQRGSGALFGNAGGTYLNLRGLESKRTLVLLDGSRVVQDDRGGTVNVGVFPTGLIKNVDIVTGGASAQYGADAVGGVVNFVLDREFEGLKATASTGKPERGGGGFSRKFGLTGGKQYRREAARRRIRGLQPHRSARARSDAARRAGSSAGASSRTPRGFADAHAGRAAAADAAECDLVGALAVTAASMRPIAHSRPASGLGTTTVPSFPYLNHVFTTDGTGVRPFVPGCDHLGRRRHAIDVGRPGVRRRHAQRSKADRSARK